MASDQTNQNFAVLTRPEIWSKLILNNLDDYGVMADCVNRDYEDEVKYAGDTVRITKCGNVTINTHDDTEPITYETPKGDQLVLVVNQQKDWGFKITTIEQKQSNIKDMQAKYSARARLAITNTKDAYLHSVGISGVASGNQLGAQTVTKADIYDLCLELYQKLADSNAIDSDGKAEDGKRPFLILPPALVKVIRKSDEAKNATTLGDETIRKGTIMQFAGFDIKQSTLVKPSTGAYSILAGTKEGITFADQILETRAMEDKDYFGIFVSGLYVYGAKVVQPTALASAVVTISDGSST